MTLENPAAAENKIRLITGAAILFGLVVGVATPSFAAQGSPSWYERISFNGDFRGRSETFIKDDDRDRHRLRYRLRLGAKTEVNDHVAFGFRLATGSKGNSGNQTLGGNDDFAPDGVYIDRAYITLTPHGKEKPLFGDSLDVTFGRMSNPFKPKGMGPALLVWDGDQQPGGVALGWGASPRDCWSSNLDVAYFVAEENGTDPARDPGVFAVQLDNDVKAHEQVRFKSQLSYYALRKLTDGFLAHGMDGNGFGGNTPGLSSNRKVDLVEFHGSTTWTGHEDWPVTAWGNVLFNASAEGAGEGKQNLAFGVGLEAGNKKAIVKVGVGYFEIEADAVPANIGDSDLFDGTTNGRGFMVYLSRALWKNTDFGIQAFFGEALDDDVAALQTETPDKRVRIQTDIKVKF